MNTKAKNDLIIISQKERFSIVDNKQFSRLAEKTQVCVPQNGLFEIPKNRETHSQEVALSSLMMATGIAISLNLEVDDIDYLMSIQNTALCHDLGIPSFGHDGAHAISKYVKAKGLACGFDDNNNNLVVIAKNKIDVRDCVIASVIKYPDRLYENQKAKYLPILEKAIDSDIAHFEKLGIRFSERPKRTMACCIMDIADENSYICSDLSDYFCNNKQVNLEEIFNFSKKVSTPTYLFDDLLSVVQTGSKNEIKAYFSKLKQELNLNYSLNENGLFAINEDLANFKKALNKISMEFYIKPIRQESFNKTNMKKLNAFIRHVFENDYYSSEYYANKSKNDSACKESIMINKRDMIAEVSDWYIIKSYEELDLKNKLNNELCLEA